MQFQTKESSNLSQIASIGSICLMTYLSLRHFFPLVFNKTMTPLFAELNFLIHQRYKSSFNLTTFLYLEFLHTNRFLFTSLGKDNPKGLSFANTILFDYSEYLFSNSLVRFLSSTTRSRSCIFPSEKTSSNIILTNLHVLNNIYNVKNIHMIIIHSDTTRYP